MRRARIVSSILAVLAGSGVVMGDTSPQAERRERLIGEIGSGVLLVRGAAPDGVNPNFFYLTGVEEPRGALLLAPDGVRIGTGRRYPGPDYIRGRIVRQVLFLPESDALAARWGEDAAATAGSASADAIGVDAVLTLDELNTVLGRALETAEVFHYVRGREPSLSGTADDDAAFVERVRRAFFGVRTADATPRVVEMRRLKDDVEVRAIERAIAVTGDGLRNVIGLVRPGMHEYQLEAELTRTYRSAGGTHAFAPIVAAGGNAVKLHYKSNQGPIAEGRLVLIDTGASLGGYKADVSRTFPAGGRFTPRQREIYELVLRAADEAIAICRPGALMADVHARAFEVIAEAGYGEYFVHGTSHMLGLETHDAGDVHRPLAPGAVLTVEPGIYLPDEEIGVRIEDDVLITDGGHRVLSARIPRTVREIEALTARE